MAVWRDTNRPRSARHRRDQHRAGAEFAAGVEDASRDPAPLSTRIIEAKKPDGSPAYTKRTALALLAFFLLACQCMSTLSAVKRETKSFVWPAVSTSTRREISRLGSTIGIPFSD